MTGLLAVRAIPTLEFVHKRIFKNFSPFQNYVAIPFLILWKAGMLFFLLSVNHLG